MEVERRVVDRRASDRDVAPRGSEAIAHGPKHTFALPATVYFTVDNFGKVISLSIAPSMSEPDYVRSTEETPNSGINRVRAIAESNGWFFQPLIHLPRGVRWES